MTYYVLKGQIITLLVSLSHLSVVSFPEKIQEYAGSHQGKIRVHQLNSGRSLAFEPKARFKEEYFTVFTKNSRYSFKLVFHKKYSDYEIQIQRGLPCSLFHLLKESTGYQLFECPQSLFFVNKNKKPLEVNGVHVRGRAYLSKGPAIFLNNKMIYYKGVSL